MDYDGQDLKRTLRIFVRNRKTFLWCTATLFALCLVAIFNIPSNYVSTAMIAVDAPIGNIISRQQTGAEFNTVNDIVKTEREVLTSGKLVQSTAEKIPDLDDPMALAAHVTPALQLYRHLLENEKVAEALDDIADGGESDAADNVNPDSQGAATNQAARQMLERTRSLNKFLEIRAVDGANVIEINARTLSPALSAKIVNEHVYTYLAYHKNLRNQISENISGFLQETIQELQQEVKEAENQLHAQTTDAGLIEGKDSQLIFQQISETSSLLTQTEGQIAGLRSRIDGIDAALNSQLEMFSVSDILQSPMIVRLRQKQVELSEELKILGQRYGARHPEIQEVNSKIAQNRSAIYQEVQKIASSIRSELDMLNQRKQHLTSTLNTLKQEANKMQLSKIGIESLSRNIDASRQILSEFLLKAKAANSDTYLKLLSVNVVSWGEENSHPAGPRRVILTVIGFLISVSIATALIIILEALDNVYRAQAQIEKDFSITPAALLPHIRNTTGHTPEDYVNAKPHSPYAEGVQNLLLSLDANRAVRDTTKLLMVTSSIPGEGKSTTSLVLARKIAQYNNRVLLIDGDVRCPTLHIKCRLENVIGFSDVIAGNQKIATVIQRDSTNAIDVITAGSPTAQTGLLSAQRIQQILDNVRDNYDVIIIDMPPAMAITDTLTMAKIVDDVVFVVYWGETRRHYVKESIKRIRAATDKKLHVVFNNIDMKKNKLYEDRDSTYYSSVYRKYYQQE